MNLVCRTTLNRSFKISCAGVGAVTPLTLSTTSVILPAVAQGDQTECNITLTNTSNASQTFEFAPPEESGLRLFPSVGTLEPEEQVRVVVQFFAAVQPTSTNKEEQHESAAGEAEQSGDAEGVSKPSDEDPVSTAADDAEVEDKPAGSPRQQVAFVRRW